MISIGLDQAVEKIRIFYGLRGVYSQSVDPTVTASAHISLSINLLVQTLLPRNRDLLEMT